MNTKTIPSDRDPFLLDDEDTGSHALYDEPSTEARLPDERNAEDDFQSSSVTASGFVWALAILGTMGGASHNVTPLHVLSTGARQYISSESPAQESRARRAIALLDEWLADESGYDEETWPHLKEAMEQDRLSSRRLFDA